jgi:AbrB family looped-hinge helix DNA binding protein
MTTEYGTARLDGRGRLLLPAELRRRLGLRAGDELVVREEPDGAVRVESRRAAARALIGLAGPAGHSMVEELRKERRREAEAEDAEARRYRAAGEEAKTRRSAP